MLSAFALASPFLAQAALAQAVPDAGSLLKQATPKPPPLQPEAGKPLVDKTATAPAQAAEAGPRVDVSGFVLEGNETLSNEALQAVLKPWLGKTADLATLREAAASVCAAYAEAGWLAHCDLPPQDITEGRIHIRVLESRFAGLKVQGAPTRFSADRAAAIVSQGLQVGDKLSITRLDRAILLVDGVPGVSASGSLSAGDKEGDTLVTLGLADSPLASADLSLDNGGQRSTGTTRAMASVRLDSPLKFGDSWTGQLTHTQGNDYLRLGASMPVGLQGWRVGVNTSALRYKLVTDDLQNLDAKGSASNTGFDASYPLVRSQARNLSLQLSGEAKHFDNQANGATTSRYRSRNFNAGLNGSIVDTHNGATFGSLTLTAGKLNLNGSPSEASDAQTIKADGSYTKLNYTLGRQQGLNSWLAASATLAGQTASKNLDTSERFYLGGPSGVRAYPSSEGGGSSGQMLNLELRAQLPRQWTGTAFFDYGHVTTLVDGAPAGSGPNAYSLKGAGLSIGWTGPAGLNLRATLARRIGSNPNPTSTGMDQDGTLKRNRVWLQASIPI